VLLKHKMLQCKKPSPNILRYQIPHYDAVETEFWCSMFTPWVIVLRAITRG